MWQDLEAGIGGRWFKGENCSSQLQYEKAEGTIVIIHHHHQQRRTEYLVWALPLATAKLEGGAPVSYHHHTPIFTVFLSSILLVISWSSRIKFWYELVLSFSLWSLYVIEFVSYIIKISVESRAWLSCYDLEGIKEKKE